MPNIRVTSPMAHTLKFPGEEMPYDEYEQLRRELEQIQKSLVEIKVSNAETHARQQGLSEKVEELRGNFRWLVRLVIGALLTAIIAFVVGGGIAF